MPKSGSALNSSMFAELAKEPWDMQWWRQVARFALRLKGMGSGALHRDIFCDNVRDVRRLAIGHVSLVFVHRPFACHLMHPALLSLMRLSTVIRPHSVCRGFGMIHTFLPVLVPALPSDVIHAGKSNATRFYTACWRPK